MGVLARGSLNRQGRTQPEAETARYIGWRPYPAVGDQMKTFLMVLGGLVLLSIAIPLALWLFGVAIGMVMLAVKVAIALAIIIFVVGLFQRLMGGRV